MMQSKNATFDSTLELCDVIVSMIERSYDSLELCEMIVAQVEAAATRNAFLDTYIGQLVANGTIVWFEGRALQHSMN